MIYSDKLDLKEKNVVYLGLELPHIACKKLTHHPVIRIEPYTISKEIHSQMCLFLERTTHIIITSKTAIDLFEKLLSQDLRDFVFSHTIFLSVGETTSQKLREKGISHTYTAKDESQEGIIDLMKKYISISSTIFWPHSHLSRSTLSSFLQKSQIQSMDLVLYSTVTNLGLNSIDMNEYDTLFFTSPSTIQSWQSLYQTIPEDCLLLTQGVITQKALDTALQAQRGSKNCHEHKRLYQFL